MITNALIERDFAEAVACSEIAHRMGPVPMPRRLSPEALGFDTDGSEILAIDRDGTRVIRTRSGGVATRAAHTRVRPPCSAAEQYWRHIESMGSDTFGMRRTTEDLLARSKLRHGLTRVITHAAATRSPQIVREKKPWGA
jgi:hypothetical protein